MFFSAHKMDLVLIWSEHDHQMMSCGGLKNSNLSKIGSLRIEKHVLQLEEIR